ncbi:glycosyltransferase family 2 protein [Microvirga brassicacearum]|uniref:Glycosyltransferase family 2 protein n=1 Tax=Microvirga brassicacearum TaxID=2580413 RepID=A0A5N3P6B0_9HYPH|nr:glycosyltransferase family 2 protein [Microvirga brassicacearum]KAB0265276.1 glycosyltransferase family 2 protein [Microvirga brassicacearum]
MASPELSVIIPVHNESANIAPLCARLLPVLNRLTPVWEIIFVDDGSPDDTLALIKVQSLREPRIGAVSFSRNFGKEVAIAAGLDHVRGDAVVIMDADLQHPPEMIEAFVAKWREGYLMVYGQRTDRSDETRVKRGFAHLFYRLFSRFGEISLPEGAGDFRLIDRKGVEVLRTLGEKARFSKGLYAWIGFKSTGVPFVVEDRLHGTTQWSFRKLFRFAFDGIASFSTVPLRVWTYLGTLISICSIATATYFLVSTLLFGTDLPGFPSLIVSLTFFSGVQLLSLGIIGEYVGRIFAEVKRRPLYVVAERVGTAAEVSTSLVQDDPRLRRA